MPKEQYFVTLDDAELARLGGSGREYTSPRDDQSSKVEGWIRGNTKIGPVLEAAVSYHQGHCGIEIIVKSLLGDGSYSWIMIVNGLNKYVTEMSKETHKNRNDENWRQCRETCCESKTETNINADAIFFESVCLKIRVFSALVNSNMGELLAKRR